MSLAKELVASGLTKMEARRLEDALADFELAIRIDAGLGRAHAYRAWVLAARHRLDEATESAERGVSSSPDDPVCYAMRGVVHEDRLEWREAIADFTRAIALDFTDLAEAYNSRACSYLRVGEDDKALRDWAEATSLDPALHKPFINRGRRHHARGEHELALAQYDRACELRPRHFDIRDDRALTRMALGRWREALEDLEVAVALEASKPNVHSNRGVCWFCLGEPGRAVELFTQALQLEPGDREVRGNRGIALVALGRMAEALPDLESGLDADPANEDLLAAMNEARAAAGRS